MDGISKQNIFFLLFLMAPRLSSLKLLLSLGQEDKSTSQAQQNILIMTHVFTRLKIINYIPDIPSERV